MVAADAVTTSLKPKSVPILLQKAQVLVEKIKAMTTAQLKKLCEVSDNLITHVKTIYDNTIIVDSKMTVAQCENDKSRFNQAGLMFDGPAFKGLDAASFSNDQAINAQNHLRILCGLYGVVKPGDFIQEYRLCMGSKLAVEAHKDLYSYWGDDIANEIIDDLQRQLDVLEKETKSRPKALLVNVASQEYFKVVQRSIPADVKVIECIFRDAGTIKTAYAKVSLL